MEKYDAALDYYNKALTIRQKVLPSNHRDIAMTYNNLGTLYEDRQDFSKALEYYQKSLEINHKILPPEHRDLVGTESNIQKLKGKMKK
jgi:tetratricopeptide (TPR) repeat protein